MVAGLTPKPAVSEQAVLRAKAMETQDTSPSHIHTHVCIYVYSEAYMCMYVVYESKGGENKKDKHSLFFSS